MCCGIVGLILILVLTYLSNNAILIVFKGEYMKNTLEGIEEFGDNVIALIMEEQPSNIKNLILLFVKNAVNNNLSCMNIVECLKNVPAEYADLITAQFSERKGELISRALKEFYTVNFIRYCDGLKYESVKPEHIDDYICKFRRKKTEDFRYISLYELIIIAEGLKIPFEEIVSNDEQKGDKYQIKLTQLYNQRCNVKYRNAEYRLLNSIKQQLLQDSIKKEDEIIAKRTTAQF